jgi:hypothetical protein
VAEGEAKNLYLAFLPKGVVAFATDPQDRALLTHWLSGHGATGGTPAAKALGSIGTGSAMWLVVTEEKSFAPDVQATMKAVYGQAELAGASINADFHIVTASAKEASDLAAFASKQIDDMKKSGNVPPEAMGVVKSLKVGASGSEVSLKASMPEKDALSFLTTALRK